MEKTERQENLQRWKRLCSFADCATSAAGMHDDILNLGSEKNPCDVNPLYAERRLMDAAYEFANLARHMLHENRATGGMLRARAEGTCRNVAEMVSALELETTRLRDLQEKQEDGR